MLDKAAKSEVLPLCLKFRQNFRKILSTCDDMTGHPTKDGKATK